MLLSNGDINTDVPESDLLDAQPDSIGMNIIDYDAMDVGNHEFDNHLDLLAKQTERANIYKNGERMFDAYKIFDKDCIKIAAIGLTPEDIAKISNLEFIKQVTFTDPKEEAKLVIAEIKAKHNPDFLLQHPIFVDTGYMSIAKY